MRSNKPYLVRALFDWIVDNEVTPYILVDAFAADVEVPTEFVKDGQIVLNIAPEAVRDFFIDSNSIAFSARFSGIPTSVFVPMHAIAGIYAKENGQGMMFEPEAVEEAKPTLSTIESILSAQPPAKLSSGKVSSKPTLRLVK